MIAIMVIIIIINVKSFLENFFCRISINSFRKLKNSFHFNENKAVLYTATLMHCKARHVLRDLFSTNQRNGSEITFVDGDTKSTSDIWKPSYDWMT